MERAIWRLSGVTVRGADRARLHAVTLDIPPGVTAVVGPSGAGKTTLLNLLVGFEKPDEGRVECGLDRGDGKNGVPLFWCPPDHGLWPHLSVRGHLEAAASASMRGRIDETLAAFDLHDHAGQRPDHLSQGQRSRLSVARSLVTGARVHVMDEPLVHVDEEAAPRYWRWMMGVIAQTGASWVFCTHNSAVARETAQRVIRLRAGRVVAAAVLMIAALFTGGCGGGDEDSNTFHVEHVSQHTLPSEGLKAPRPRDLALGEGDELLAIDNAGRIVVLDRAGKVLRMFHTPANKDGNPEGVTRLHDGRIAVADTHYFQVLFFDGAGGKLLSILGSEGEGPGQFHYPVKVVEDDKGNLYVSEYGGNDRIQKFAPDGRYITSIGSFGLGEGQFQRPSGLVWHDGKLYIADAINNRVLIYSDTGAYLGLFAPGVSLDLPYDLDRGPDGSIYVVEYGAGRLTVLDATGQLVGRFNGGAEWRMETPWGLVVDRKGVIWIADTGNGRILRVER